MKFVAGSPLTEAELMKISESVVNAYGEAAPEVVSRRLDEASNVGDFVEHAKWINVSLGVLMILRGNAKGAC